MEDRRCAHRDREPAPAAGSRRGTRPRRPSGQRRPALPRALPASKTDGGGLTGCPRTIGGFAPRPRRTSHPPRPPGTSSSARPSPRRRPPSTSRSSTGKPCPPAARPDAPRGSPGVRGVLPRVLEDGKAHVLLRGRSPRAQAPPLPCGFRTNLVGTPLCGLRGIRCGQVEPLVVLRHVLAFLRRRKSCRMACHPRDHGQKTAFAIRHEARELVGA